jgi:ferric-dicitrate binding protein FerR (iron transport regulator)
MKSDPDSTNRINDLIIKYLTEDIKSEELEELRLWINYSDENKELFNNFKDSWNMAGQAQETVNFNSEKSYSQLDSKLTRNSEKRITSKVFIFLQKYAAVALLFMTIGGGISWLLKPSHSYSKLSTVINAPLGAKSVIDLPDGTKVWLNAGSTIKYNPDYGKETRTIHLVGEAFFSVAKDKTKPFYVKTDRVTVKALGTRFNVKAYPEEKMITTTLEEGKVELETPVIGSNNTRKILLKPNEKVVYYKPGGFSTANTTEKTQEKIENKPKDKKEFKDLELTHNINTTLYTSWKDERWILESEPLGALKTVMERRFNIKMVFDNIELENYKFTGTIENETLEQILSAFKLTAPLEYTINKDTVVFTLNKTLKEKYNRITDY